MKQPLIKEHFFNPQNVGAISLPDAEGESASISCGGIVRLTLRIDNNKRVTDARFKAAGCSFLVATASLITEEIKEKSTAEAALIAQHQNTNQCDALCRSALLSAVTHYSDAMRDEWTGPEALICTCFGVSENEIEGHVRSAGLHSVEEVTRACKAGAGCRSCYPLIQEILDVHWREQGLQS